MVPILGLLEYVPKVMPTRKQEADDSSLSTKAPRARQVRQRNEGAWVWLTVNRTVPSHFRCHPLRLVSCPDDN